MTTALPARLVNPPDARQRPLGVPSPGMYERHPTRYDAIVVGARCGGSPTAMLLARSGHRVLLVDKATFPSDTISTHLIHPPGIEALHRWGLLERVVDTGCPPIRSYTFDFGPFAITGSPGTDAAPVSYGPRRTILDKLLVDAAAEAGAEVREGFTVEDLVFEDGRVAGVTGHDKGGSTVTERARVVVGADGLHSRVADEDPARAVRLPEVVGHAHADEALLAACSRSAEGSRGFVRVYAGVDSPADFFAPANAERIFAAAAQA